ncbi:hypothetical protein [Marinomonas sp. 2405UD68-3]|uniref:hypothetical protein n=1 Tax=Marinomonas sp. 2405UD68-3 TaxID=3391835 RepID=UPI0039C8C0DD
MMTRTENTEREYRLKLKTIYVRYFQREDNDGSLNSREKVLSVFSKIESALTTNSAKKYRAVLRWHCRNESIKLEKNDMKITLSNSKSLKMKTYPKDLRLRVLKLINSVARPRESVKRFVELHLKVGVLVGYRLNELRDISVEVIRSDKFGGEDRCKVIIVNGKATNGRSNGDTRWIELPEKFDGFSVSESISELKELYLSSPKMLGAARSLHMKVVNVALKRRSETSLRPTLSSTRHEFKVSVVEACGGILCSAAMGHISSDTQKRHYGKRNLNSSKIDKDLVKFHKEMVVSPENIERVRVIEREKIWDKIVTGEQRKFQKI